MTRWSDEGSNVRSDAWSVVCVCVCVCVRACLYVCWGEIVLCDRMSAACLSVGVRLCFACRVSVSCK